MIMVEYDRGNNSQRTAPAGHYSTAHQPHHGSPHLHHLDRPSAHSTPSPPYQYAVLPHLGAQQQQPGIRQTPTSYPSPASYPSPSMSAYPYPPQQAHQPSSRGSPYSQPSQINLPPIRLNPPATQLVQSSHDGALGSPLPQQSMHAYYTHALPPPAVSHTHITSSPIHQNMRFPLPAVGNPERIMSGGRHKKEIKRRTKTGCLTCRKRRIKCDEGHPTCKNCQKSKRDCLGYDPIFKSQPGPAAIQPAPSGGSNIPMSGPAGSYAYAMNTVTQNYGQSLSTTASSPASSCDTYDYPQIDPALDAATSHPHASAPPSLPDPQLQYRPDLKRPLDRTSPFSSASDTNSHRTPQYTPIPRSSTPGQGQGRQHQHQHQHLQDLQGNTAKRIKIDDLLSVGSSQPLSPPASELATNTSPSSTSVESMTTIYATRYAPALDGFLEVNWFCNNGLQTIRSDGQLAELMAEVFERLKARGGSYYEEEDPAIHKSNKDIDLLWAAIRLCYGTRIPVSDNRRDDEARGGDRTGDEATETYRRINIIENLLGGRLECNPASPRIPPSDKPNTSIRGGQFWFLMEQIASFKSTGPEANHLHIHMLLEECRRYVEAKPNRELLHAIAEIYHIRSEAAEGRRDALKKYVEGIATDRSMSIVVLDRRIAGRAMGIWTAPVTELPFCMPAV